MTCPFGTPQFDADRGVMSKCHLCAPRVDDGRAPSCVAACPTGALTFAADVDADGAPVREFVPGFADPAGCRPNLRFTTPAGATRSARFDEIEERLRT